MKFFHWFKLLRNRFIHLSRKVINLRLSKRKQFVIAVVILGIGLLATQLVAIEQRNEMVIGLALASFLISAFVLREDLMGVEYLTLTILPTMFTVAVAFFYFLLPVRWLTRLPTAFLYMLGMYAILLTENIYNVAAERSIQLLRAAHSVGFLTTLVTVFLFYDTIFSFHANFYFNAFLVLMITFPLVLQSLWSMVLKERLTVSILLGSFLISLLLSQTAFMISFWPINTTILSLFLTTLFYSLTGIFQQRLIDRLFPNTLKEFISVVLVTFFLVLITTRWTG